MKGMRNVNTILVAKTVERRQLRKVSSRRDDEIETDPQEII
jgi:hypothetical protein